MIPAVGANVTAVAEYVIAAVLNGLRGVFFSTADIAAGAWPRQTLIGREAAEKTIGLVGFGAIARAVVPRAKALGMRALAYDPYVPDEAIREAGVVGPSSRVSITASMIASPRNSMSNVVPIEVVNPTWLSEPIQLSDEQ